MTDVEHAIIEAANHSRRLVRQEIAAWLVGVRHLRRHGQHTLASSIERHAADFKAWAGARPIRV